MSKTATEVTYQLTKEDIREAVVPFVRRFVLRFWAAVIVLVVVVEVILWVIALGSEEPDYAFSYVTLFAGIAWLPIGWWLGLRTAARAADPYVFEKRTVRADGSGLDVERETGHSTLPWSFFQSWRESDNLIILTHGEATYFPVPHRAFGSDDERQEFVRLLRSHIGASQARTL